MALITRENPYGIDPVRDLHHSPPRYDIPGWSENLLFSGTDAVISLLVTVVRWRIAGVRGRNFLSAIALYRFLIIRDCCRSRSNRPA